MINPILQQMLNSPIVRNGNNPIINNVLNMYKNNDVNGLKSIAENICREKGSSLNGMQQMIANRFNNFR